jgi:hypothetical protein
MSGDVQRVVVIQDATREINLIAIRWVLHGFSLNLGDAIILFGAFHQVNNPSTLSFTESENLCKNLCLFFSFLNGFLEASSDINVPLHFACTNPRSCTPALV